MYFKTIALCICVWVCFMTTIQAVDLAVNLYETSVTGLNEWANKMYKFWFNEKLMGKKRDSLQPYVLMIYLDNYDQELNCGNFTDGIVVKKVPHDKDIYETIDSKQKRLHNTAYVYKRISNGNDYYEMLKKNNLNDLKNSGKNLVAALYSDKCVLARAVQMTSKVNFQPHYEEIFAYYLYTMYNNMPPAAKNVRMLAFSGKKPCSYGDQDCKTNHLCTQILKDIGHRENKHNVNWANYVGKNIGQRLLYFSRLETKNTPLKYGYIKWNAPQTNNQCPFKVLETEAERLRPVLQFYNDLQGSISRFVEKLCTIARKYLCL